MGSHVMIILVGGRQAPNVIGVTSYRPDIVEAVVSEDERKDTWPALRETLEALPGVEVRRPHFISAYDVEAARKACEAALARHPGAFVSFNLTCGTKLMGFGAHAATCSAEAAGRDVAAFYLDTGGGHSISVAGQAMPAPSVPQTLPEYLRAYGREVRNSRKWHPSMVTGGETEAARVAHAMARGEDPHFEPRTIADQHLVEQGHWLEAYVYEVARNLVSKGSKKLFADARASQDIRTSDGATNEADLLALYHGQVLICSCKTGTNALETQNLNELRAVSSLIGGRYCSRILVTDQPTSTRRGALRQADTRKVVVVGRERLLDLGTVLLKEALDPTYPRL